MEKFVLMRSDEELLVNRGKFSQLFAKKAEGLDLVVLVWNIHEALGHVAISL